MSRSIAVSELKRRRAAIEAQIATIDGAIAVLEAGVQHRQRRNGSANGNPMAAAHAALAEKRAKGKRGRPAKAAPASIAEVAE